MPKTNPRIQKAKSFRYHYFSAKHRLYLKHCIESLTEYVANNDIKNIVFVDRSARSAWIGFYTYWKLNFSDRKMPTIYFFNPDGFDYSYSEKLFSNTFTRLINEKDLPMVIFDTCAHTGETLNKITVSLNDLGFSKINVITANPPERRSRIKTACVIDKYFNEECCYPFGMNNLVKRKEKSFVCKRRHNSDVRKSGLQIRKEIRQTVIDDYVF